MTAKKYKLVCFDVDGTLISDDQGKYWMNLHRVLEGPDWNAKQQERERAFRSGRISYDEWTALDLGDLKRSGATKTDFERVAQLHKLLPGARETIHELKARGYKLAVISGSLGILIDTLFPDHPFDDLFINNVFFDENGKLSRWETTQFDEGKKHGALHAICEREGIDLAHTVFVGDGENDIDILKEAGLGIAFMPKSENVTNAADVVVRKNDVKEILKYL